MSRDAVLDDMERLQEPWNAHQAKVSATGFWAMARRLPSVLTDVLGECRATSPRDTAQLVACTLAAEIFTAISLLATTDLLNGLLRTGPTPTRLRAVGPAVLAIVLAIILRTALRESGEFARTRLAPQMRRTIHHRLLSLTTDVELSAFDDGDFSNRLHRVRLRAPEVMYGLLYGALRIVSGIIALLAVAGVLTSLHPLLLPLLFLAVIPVWWASVRSARLAYQLYTTLSGASRRMSSLVELMAERGPAAEIRAHAMRPFLMGQWDRLSRYVLTADLRKERLSLLNRLVGITLGGLGIALVYLVLAVLLLTGHMPLAAAGTAVIAIRTIVSALVSITGNMNLTYEHALFFQDYLDFCKDAATRLERRGGTPPPADLDDIALRGVSFTYPSATEPALKDITLDVRPGEIVALVGENGSGKTTLAKLIGALYPPTTGTLTYGGVPYDDIDLTRLREQIAVIPQNYTHWPFSARQNITFGRPGTDRHFSRATMASGADQVLARLPHGPETLLDPSFRGGTELSGGQWQRIAVARGLCHDAPLLICDEPTASVDARTEHAIFQTLQKHAAQRTVILITHRLANARHADRIYVLHKGQVVEHGDHLTLMAEEGRYHAIYTLQTQVPRQVTEA